MIVFDRLRLYTMVTDGPKYYPLDKAHPFLLVYFSENSTFSEDYHKLNIRYMDVRSVVIPVTRYPRTRLMPDYRKLLRSYKLFPYPVGSQPPKQNLIYDTSLYVTSVDAALKPVNYRQRAGRYILSILDSAFAQFPDYRKTLLYVVDITKPFPKYINRKIFPVLMQIRDGNFLFDNFLLCTIGPKGPRYRLLMKDKQYNFQRLYMYVKATTYTEVEEEETEEKAEAAATLVVSSIPKEVLPEEKKDKVKQATKDFLKTDKSHMEKVLSKEVSDEYMSNLAIASVLQKVSGNFDRTKNLWKIMSVKKVDPSKVLKKVAKDVVDQILVKKPPVNTATDPVTKHMDVVDVTNRKSPEHLFQKRQIDFQTNLKKDVTNSFKVLEKKETPLYVKEVSIEDKEKKPGSLEPSDISVVKVSLQDASGRKHDVSIEIPKIDKFGTFRVNGQRKCLVNQVVTCPISFPKKYDSRFESSYSSFHIYSKRGRINYLEAFIASYKIPLLVLLSYVFGFEETLKAYGIKYKVQPKQEGEFSVKIAPKTFVVFENVDSELKRELVNSFSKAGLWKLDISAAFPTKEFFTEALHKITGRINSSYLVNEVTANVVDPVARQILINMQLPSDLFSIIFYMSSKVVEGYVQERTDLSNLRVRGSEVLTHLIQKQVLAAFTAYREQVLSGNKNPQFTISPTKVLHDFVNSDIVTLMEFANPVEEMSSITRTTPIGRGVGGIADREAIQIEARNVHPSFFGNIDPLDTPEGPNVGVTQQLAIDATVTSARGLFQVKPIDDREGAGILSTSTCLIPFVENNDGVRIMMAANQARQAQPLKDPEPPIVRSGFESLLTNVLSDNFVKRSPCNGVVRKVTRDSIVIACRTGKQVVDITPVHLRSGSGKNTLSVFIPKVVEGQSVKQGSIIAEGSCISDGTIALGRTLCVCLMPYKGYNFEDAIVINEKLVENDKLTSLHGITIDVDVSEKDRLLYIASIGQRTEKGQILLKKSIGEVEELIGYEEERDDIDVAEGYFVQKSPGGVVVDIEVFCNTNPAKFPALRDLIERTNKKHGVSSGNYYTREGRFKGIKVRFKVEQELKIQLGDKLCNRYGNKGIISLIEKDDLMPRTPWGETVDVILNPIGVLSRMNVGQLFEMYTGLISRALAFKFLVLSRTQAIDLARKVLQVLDTSKNQQFSSSFIRALSNLSERAYKEFLEKLKKSTFLPIVIPPFAAPKQDKIRAALRLLGLEPAYHLYLPEFGTKTHYKVPVGYMYILKLEHLGEMKLHARSTGPTISRTLQPTAGKRREGGQRVGEADTYALISQNCLKVLDELFGPLSDDVVTKEEIISDIVRTGSAKWRPSKTSPIRELVNSYFIALMLERQ